jgi:phosphoribosylformimino-5-aminoimidazole carboxamide ribotide isomerase
MGGQVVHARYGMRAGYRPLRSGLVDSSAAADVVAALLNFYPFKTLYIADLDAIQKTGTHAHVVRDLRERFPALELWIDAGIGNSVEYAAFQRAGIGRPVIGTESVFDPELLAYIGREPDKPVLSLDFHGGELRGPARWWDDTHLWPARVIVMTLDQVGSDQGPDLGRIAMVRRRVARCEVFAAGGVRNRADLEELARSGARGVLLATALHCGRITQADISSLMA